MLDDLALMAAVLGKGAGTPLAIFGSRLMWWYDLSDISTLSQDNTFLTPVTALDDPIGGIRDKSGKGNHATQGTAISKPLWKRDGNNCYNALFDGSNDSWQTSAIDLTSSDKVAVFASIRKLDDAAVGIVAEFSPTLSSNSGTFFIAAPGSSGTGRLDWSSKGTVKADATSAGLSTPISAVVTGIGDISGDSSILRVNGAQAQATVTDQGSGNYGNFALNIGRRNNATLPLNGAIYQLFGVLGSVTAAEIAAAETFANSKILAY